MYFGFCWKKSDWQVDNIHINTDTIEVCYIGISVFRIEIPNIKNK